MPLSVSDNLLSLKGSTKELSHVWVSEHISCQKHRLNLYSLLYF